MIDIGQIRSNPELYERTAKWKGIGFSVERLLETDDKRRQLVREVEPLRALRNRLSEDIPALLREGRNGEAEGKKKQAVAVKEKLAELEARLQAVEREFEQLMLLVPNPVSADTPIGASDKDNVQLRTAGRLPAFDFEPKDHIALGTSLRLLDLERGVKIAGSRNYVLTGMGLHLHRAVQQLAIDLLCERGYTAMDVPLMVGKDTLVNSGFFPTGVEQTYAVHGEDKWLVGTSEASLIAYYGNEIVDVGAPIRLAAVSNCFRKEVGSAGRDVQGLYRVHQFAKVEQVIICKADPAIAEELHAEITRNAEELLELLELPYRVVAVCTGDMSQKNHKQYDIETWMPSRGGYGETHSSSSLLDFQARRSNIRYRDETGALRYCYTLNNTAVASPRILIPLLEIHQRQDGSVRIPKALQKYMMGAEIIS
ncbi:serine--tRNA ligase [Paenibacillus thermotolerans]|uniref:serine--tRNA ligase n=1 Tax=Paenibacillus thermotolerans TaxID=3027807 RepID=UPI002368C1A3|nr:MULTISPECIES: serine--tRNA ligase [unclassified Paenibacillus]